MARKAVMMLVRVNVDARIPAAAARAAVRDCIINQRFDVVHAGRRLEDWLTAVTVRAAPRVPPRIGRRA
jgi:hypothetical protein